MNQERISKLILDIRKKNKLTQKEFADKFNVTYQAVSKWENGKNIPDISILKNICEEYNININEFLDIKSTNKKSSIKNIICIFVFLIILCTIFLIQFNYSKSNNFEHKVIEANCDNFNVLGSIAYDDYKSSIFINKVNYCGALDNTKYKDITCSLYEIDGNKSTKVGDCGYKFDEPLTLNEYLDGVKFNIDNYVSVCKKYETSILQLEIDATDTKDKVTTYKIPLKLSDNCE